MHLCEMAGVVTEFLCSNGKCQASVSAYPPGSDCCTVSGLPPPVSHGCNLVPAFSHDSIHLRSTHLIPRLFLLSSVSFKIQF